MSKRSKQVDKAEWVSSREAAVILDVGIRQVQYWANDGRFGPCKTFGRRWIPRVGVEKFVKQGVTRFIKENSK